MLRWVLHMVAAVIGRIKMCMNHRGINIRIKVAHYRILYSLCRFAVLSIRIVRVILEI
jgi:hypothetical protein